MKEQYSRAGCPHPILDNILGNVELLMGAQPLTSSGFILSGVTKDTLFVLPEPMPRQDALHSLFQ
jgi:hypothetical protein